MNDFAGMLLWSLARTAFWLSVAAVSTAFLLRALRCQSPSVHRRAWGAVLLSGWLFLPAKVTIPWYQAPRNPHSAQRAPAAEMIEVPALGGTQAQASTDVAMPVDHPSLVATEPAYVRRAVAHWPSALAVCWLLGLTAIAARWLTSYVRFLRHLPRGLPAAEAWQAEWNDVLAELAVRRNVRLLLTDGIGPLVCRTPGGYRLFVPVTLWQVLSPPERRAILRHELAHVSRGDLVKSLVARCLALPHWFNPFVWWAVRNFDECGEWACDDAVRRGEAAEAVIYARVLLRLGQSPTRLLFGAAIGGRRLSTRVKRMLNAIPPEDSTVKKTALVAFVSLLVTVSALDLRLVARSAEQEADAARGDPNVDPAFYQDMADVAAKTYEATAASYEMGTEIMANVYVWSRRWLDAERALATSDREELAALKAHRERMKLLMRKVRALYVTGSKGGEAEKYYASRYYLAEANAWLAAAKHRDAANPSLKVKVSFRGPKGMLVRWQEHDPSGFDSQPLACPGSHEFLEGRLYFLQFSGIGTVKLEALLDLTDASEKSLPVQLTLADVKKIATRHWVRKVFVSIKESDIEVVTAWDDERDAITRETERAHEVVAVLDIGPE